MAFFMTAAEKREASMAEEKLVRTLLSQKDEIKRRLLEIEAVNQKLNDAVRETRETAGELTKKLKGDFKVVRKSFISFSKKLPSGVMILNYEGKILQINPSGEKIFGVREEDLVNHSLSDLIYSIGASDGSSEQVELDNKFFLNLSNHLLEKMQTCEDSKKQGGVCTKCIHEALPSFVNAEQETTINVSCRSELDQTLNFSFSVLDNNPDELSDITYVLIFRKYLPSVVK